MNSYQYLEQETKEAIEANDEPKLIDLMRRIGNLSVSPTCSGYPWKNLTDQITPLLKGFDRDKILAGMAKLLAQRFEPEDVEGLDDFELGMVDSFNAGFQEKKSKNG